jgi:hypothetical protein
MMTRGKFLRVDRARWDVRQKADPANCRRGKAPTWNGMNVALKVNALHLGDSSPWGRLSLAASLFVSADNEDVAVAVAGCRTASVTLEIGGAFWLIELPELPIELAQQLGNPFG